MWRGVLYLVREIKRCEAAGATTAGVAMAYICIDTMAFLSMPREEIKHGRADFTAWVDSYLKCHEEQPYQYKGIDLYGARCALLHAFGSEADFHLQNPNAKRISYHDGGRHAFDPTVNEHLVLIGTASFLNDLVCAVEAFMQECEINLDLRERVESRLPKVLATFPVSNGEDAARIE